MNSSITYYTKTDSPLGTIILTATEQGLSGLYFENQRHFPAPAITNTWQQQDALFKEALTWLQAYFKGEQPRYSGPLAPQGTAFAQQVWQQLQGIAPGDTRSYQQIAESIGNPKAVRAVGAAIGRNPISLIIPCHRVIGANGSLTGYAGGVDRKRQLLLLEGAIL